MPAARDVNVYDLPPLADPEVKALLDRPDHSTGHTYDTSLPAR
jgi:hypothetical protein